MTFRTYDVDTLLDYIKRELIESPLSSYINPLEHHLERLVADDLGVPVEDVLVENQGGEWVAIVKMPPMQYITVTFDRPAPEPIEEGPP